MGRVMGTLRGSAIRANLLMGRLEPRAWLIGDGRSGTTWLSDLINAERNMLERFEPFHPNKNPRFGAWRKLEYRRPGVVDDVLEPELRATFEGRYWSEWSDSHARKWIFRGILVKDIFASLLLKWAVERIPDIRPVLLIRNPFAVAWYKMMRPDWLWANDLSLFLNDSALMEDHLWPFECTLRKTHMSGEIFLVHIAIWAIIHKVLTRQFSRRNLHVEFFEDAVMNGETARIMIEKYLGLPQISHSTLKYSIPSRVSCSKNVDAVRKNPYGNWREGIDKDLILKAQRLLCDFDFDQIYCDKGRPDIKKLKFIDD